MIYGAALYIVQHSIGNKLADRRIGVAICIAMLLMLLMLLILHQAIKEIIGSLITTNTEAHLCVS